MKGIEKYLRKHGYHFTKELVEDVIPLKWNVESIMDSAQKKVYYNVTGATSGDMAYLVNTVYADKGWSKIKCIDFTLAVISDFGVGVELAFTWFLDSIKKEGFDFTPYI